MVHIEKFTFNPFQENTYVVSNESKSCFIVDPGCYNAEEENALREYIVQNDLKPEALINTHCHIDHVFGNRFIYEAFGLKPFVHQNEIPVLEAVPQVAHLYNLNYTESPSPLQYDGKSMKLLGMEWDIIEAPGHSPGHIILYQKDEGILLAGDVIFRMSIGRTDLPGGNHEDLIRNIKEKVFTLPENTRILPGHMEETSVGFEKKNNPFF
jgi:glyoxylase-like metal-dependent hydrolase (beta-lactamase superfamily II)